MAKGRAKADNLIVAFRDTSSAVKAALEMREVVHAYNRSLEARTSHNHELAVAKLIMRSLKPGERRGFQFL